MSWIFIVSCILVTANLSALAWKDLKEYLLPDMLNLALGLSLLALHISSNWTLISPINSLLGASLGGGFLLAVRYLAEKFYRDDSLGLGDVKMITAAGLGLGFPDIFIAVSLGSCIGLIHGLFISCRKSMPLAEVQVPAGFGLSIGILTIILIRIMTL